MSETPLLQKWRQYLGAGDAGLHLADPKHPLQTFIGQTDVRTPRMVIRSSEKPAKPTLSNVVLVERYEDQSGKWNLSLTLQDSKFEEVFLRLADDVHGRSAGAGNEHMALDRVRVVFDEWRRLLKPRAVGVLSMEELRGLVGELWLLLSEFANPRSMDAAVDGWLGPLGLPQDFWYPEDGFYEAKAVGPSTTRVRISSENQLDQEDLELLVLQVANTDEGTQGAINLPALAGRVLEKLAGDAASVDPFHERMERMGVNLAEEFYRDTWFVVTRVTGYDVLDSFPAIRASALPAGVQRVIYQVELAAIEEFKSRSMEVG